jgi:hypothetical protein
MINGIQYLLFNWPRYFYTRHHEKGWVQKSSLNQNYEKSGHPSQSPISAFIKSHIGVYPFITDVKDLVTLTS